MFEPEHSGFSYKSCLLEEPCSHGIRLHGGVLLVRCKNFIAPWWWGSPRPPSKKIKAETCSASTAGRAVPPLSELAGGAAGGQSESSWGSYFPLCFGHQEAHLQICTPPLESVQDFKAPMSLPRSTSDMFLSSCLVPLLPDILIHLGCPAVSYVLATRCLESRRDELTDVSVFLSFHEDRAGKSIWATGWGTACLHIGKQASCLLHGGTFCIFTWFAFYTFGRLWFSEIICLGVNHQKWCL